MVAEYKLPKPQTNKFADDRSRGVLAGPIGRYSDNQSSMAFKIRRMTQVTPNILQNPARGGWRPKTNGPRETTAVITKATSRKLSAWPDNLIMVSINRSIVPVVDDFAYQRLRQLKDHSSPIREAVQD